jgi:hypothetical protein
VHRHHTNDIMGSGLLVYFELVSRYKEETVHRLYYSAATRVALTRLKTGVHAALPSGIMGGTLLSTAPAVRSDVWPLRYRA